MHGLNLSSDRARLLVFLGLNFFFMFAEVFYGILTNSLALISDAFHMVFDCISLVVSLYAMSISSKPPSNSYTFGFIRTETLAAFVNGVLLLFVSFFLLFEGFLRVFSPPDISHTPQLLTVAILGLLVNLVGVFFFSHHSHSHSHDDVSTTHGDVSHNHSHHENMRGVFLHILADTLGSVGVVIACITVMKKGWMIADPLVSLAISSLIFKAALPLVLNSGKTLLMVTSSGQKEGQIRRKVLTLPFVLDVVKEKFFVLVPGKNVLFIKVKVSSRDHLIDDLIDEIRGLLTGDADKIFIEVC
ncbi:hypothetical protein P9112_000350 [Eukaryota sp. TZLM1-RC]